jgi:transposase
MDFREATESLCAGLSHEELAKELGVSVATIRQARLRPEAKAHRSPPDNWREAVRRLAEQRASQYQRLISELDNGRGRK